MTQDSRKAFGDIVAQYSEKLYWVIRRMVFTHEDTDDLLQNTFMKAWGAWENFRNDSNAYTWLYRIAINETLDFIRKQKVRGEFNSTMPAQNKGSDDDDSPGVAAITMQNLLADPYFDGDEVQAKLQEAISTLPEVQRQVFTLRYYEDMPYKDISLLLDTSEGALKASYHHAVKKIKKYFSNEE